MTESLLDLSGKIEPLLVSIFEPIAEALSVMQLSGLVVGATARDMLMHHLHNVPIMRATRDIDFGIQVRDWAQYDALRGCLIGGGLFRPGAEAQRLIHESGIPVDILPFGPFARENGLISWPPDHSLKMSTLGFREACDCSQRMLLRAHPPLAMRFATAPGLTILKIIAWSDNPALRKKDAEDLCYIIRWYLELGNWERLGEEHADIVEMREFDTFRGGARLLGRDIAAVLSSEVKKRLLEVLTDETEPQRPCRLITDILAADSSLEFDSVLAALVQLKQGVDEG